MLVDPDNCDRADAFFIACSCSSKFEKKEKRKASGDDWKWEGRERAEEVCDEKTGRITRICGCTIYTTVVASAYPEELRLRNLIQTIGFITTKISQ